MASLPSTSAVSQSSLTLTSHGEQQPCEPTENEAFIPQEVPALPPLEGEIAYPPTDSKDHGARKALLPKDTRSESIASILGGLAAGVTLAVSHHIFLIFLNGRNIDEYSQYWVKNANNAFSAIFSLCIVFVATSALMQMKWDLARSKPLSIRFIDNLFSLPSPSALFTTVTSTRLRSLRLLLLPILAAVFIQSLSLVSIFAPNALTVAHSAEISRGITVPTLNLSYTREDFASLISYDATGNITVSQDWTTILTSIMLRPPLINWEIPPECGVTCKFDLVYDGPGLQCMDTLSELPPLTSEYEPKLVYNATSTLYPHPRVDPSSFWEIKDQYELRIDYISTTTNDTAHPHGGSVYCVFRNATYKASFQVENNTMEVKHAIKSYGDILGTVRYNDSDTQCSRVFSPYSPCFANGVNTRMMCEAFASVFTGTMRPTGVPGAAIVTGGINQAVLEQLFSHMPGHVTVHFDLKVPSLSKGLVSLFSNLTLGFIPHRLSTTRVQADLWDGSYAWSYTVWILWAVYLPTLLLGSLVILSGLLSIRSNKRGMDDKFSNFLLATRNTELDVVCMGAKDFAELQRFRLLYGREGTFSVASGDDHTK